MLIPAILKAAETWPIPDAILRSGSDAFVWGTDWAMRRVDDGHLDRFIAEMADHPIAVDAHAANDQHYELPPEFFALMLGAHRKYSCGYYANPGASLDDAEHAALEQSAQIADITDGQSILELGCGWGSFSLYLAGRFPNASITAMSNSTSQAAYIRAKAERRGLTNLTVLTEDINGFAPKARFDRIVSIEMFEHLSNWTAMFNRMQPWLAPDGRIYMHVFSHRSAPYRFDHSDPNDWIAHHFFTGGIMPSHDLLGRLKTPFEIEHSVRWPGTHYAQTARAWFANYDANQDQIAAVLAPVYGDALTVWLRRWRLFLFATERLFGYRNGSVWGISHYRLRAR